MLPSGSVQRWDQPGCYHIGSSPILPQPAFLSCIAGIDSSPHQKHSHTEAQESLQRCGKTTLKYYGEMLLKFGLCSPMLNRNGHRVSGEVEENSFIALPGKRGPGSLLALTEWPALEGTRVQGAGRVSSRALLTAGWWGKQASAPSTLWFQPVWRRHACGRQTVSFSTWGRFRDLQNAQRTWLRIFSTALEEELRASTSFNGLFFALLDSFPFFLHSLPSLI